MKFLLPLLAVFVAVFILTAVPFISRSSKVIENADVNSALVLGEGSDDSDEDSEDDNDNSGSSNDDEDDNDEDKEDDENKDEDDDSEDKEDDEDEDDNRSGTSNNANKVEDDDEDEDEDEKDDVDELDEDDEDEDEAEIEIEEDEVRLTSRSGPSGKAVIKIKKKSEVGEVEIKVRADGRVEIKVKSKDPSQLEALLEEVLTAEEAEQILSLIPEATGASKVKIKVKEDEAELEIEANGSEASTKFPLSVDPNTNTLVVQTPSGNVNLVVLPDRAINNLLTNGKVDTISSTDIVEVKGKSGEVAGSVVSPTGDKLVYKIKGFNNVKFLGFFPVTSEVEIEVGAQTASLISETKPWYLRFFGFLFTQA